MPQTGVRGGGAGAVPGPGGARHQPRARARRQPGGGAVVHRAGVLRAGRPHAVPPEPRRGVFGLENVGHTDVKVGA